MQIVVGILVLGILIGAFFAAYRFNKQTPAPEGASAEDCGGCKNIHCSRYNKE